MTMISGQSLPGAKLNIDSPKILAEGIERIFNDCFSSSGAHKASAKLLWQMQAEAPDEFFDLLFACLKHALLVSKGDSSVDLVIRFVIMFCTQQPREREEESMIVVEQLIRELLGLCNAVDRSIRFRVCQLLAGTFNNLPESAEITEDLADKLEAAMLERTKDKNPFVRSNAIRALSRFADPGIDGKFESDSITGAFLQALDADKNKDVRKCIIVSLTPCPRTLQPILDRVRDINEEVRKTVFRVIKEKIPLPSISMIQRTFLVKAGLADRCSSVYKSALSLLETWLHRDCKDNILALLRALGVPAMEDIPSQALLHLLRAGAIDGMSVTRPNCQAPFVSAGGTLADLCNSGAIMTPETALFWRVMCDWLNSRAKDEGIAAAGTYGTAAIVKAAAAGEYLEALDRVLPETSGEFMHYIKMHASHDHGGFVERQLILVAARCLDFADGQGRAEFRCLLHDFLCKPVAEGETEEDAQKRREALEELAVQVLPEPRSLAELIMDAIDTMQHYWEVPCTQGDDTQVTGSESKPWQWCCALDALGMLLRQWPSRRCDAIGINQAMCTRIEEAVQGIVLTAAQHNAEPVRREGIRVLGLYCLLGGQLTILPTHINILIHALEHDSEPVQAMAAKSLCDLVLFSGQACREWTTSNEQAHDDAIVQDCARGALAARVMNLLMQTVHSGFSLNPNTNEDGKAACSVVAEGLAKLLVHHAMPGTNASALQDENAIQILVALLLLHFSPSTEELSRARQCLAVALDAYAYLSPKSQQILSDAFIPAARQAVRLYPNQKKAASRNAATSLIRFMTQLLQAQAPGKTHVPLGQEEDEDAASDDARPGSIQTPDGNITHEILADKILVELLSMPKTPMTKFYVTSLCKTLQVLPIGRSSSATIKRLKILSEKLLLERKLDAVSSKDLSAFLSRVTSLDPVPEDSLPKDELEALLEAIKTQDSETELLELFGNGEKVLGGRSRPAGWQRSCEWESDSEENEDVNICSMKGGAALHVEPRKLPMRSTRQRQAPLVVDLSSEASESEVEDEYSIEGVGENNQEECEHPERDVEASWPNDHYQDCESDSSDDFQNPPRRVQVSPIYRNPSQEH